MPSNRRTFIHQLGGTAAALVAGSLPGLTTRAGSVPAIKKFSPNDRIRVATIGMGIMGFNNTHTAIKIPGVEWVGCADLYTGRLERAKEVFGKQVLTTRHYEEILDRKDIDAVIIAANDSWHSRIAIEAMREGKAVYGEKPIVHLVDQGWDVIRTHEETKQVMQIGSGRVSSIVFAKARELYRAGEIGEINSVEAHTDRQDALGAWQYTIPTDASPATVDWKTYQSVTKEKHDWDPNRFFRWRNYREYGTGVAGDLFVHLLSGLHFITGSKGPERIFAIGGLTYWKDGRNVPDVMSALLHYPKSPEHPAFQLSIRVNFASGTGGGEMTRIVGTEGVIEMNEGGFTIHRHKMPKAPGIGGWDSLETFPEKMQQNLLQAYNKKWSKEDQTRRSLPDISFNAPENYNENIDHHTNFFNAVRTGGSVVEDPVFGFRAAAPCLACNESYFQNKVINWDPINMKLI